MSELALRLMAENKKTREPFLDLGNCGLTEVPEEIGELMWLEELAFANTRWDENGFGWESKNTGPSNNITLLPSSFARLQSLKRLYLNGDIDKTFALDDLSPLAGLTNLQKLYINDTAVSDLSPLAGLTNLQTLDIERTQVSDLSPLAGLTNLQTLHVQRTQVSDLSPLVGLANLQTLDVTYTKVSDLSPLAGLANLQRLDVTHIQISDLSPLAGLTNLRRLDVTHTLVSDLSPLAGLTNLQTLHVWNTQVSDLSPLAGLTNLQRLYVIDTEVSDLSPLAGLTNLQVLHVGGTRVSDLSPLARLTNLQMLHVWNTQVSDLSPLAGLTNLQTIAVWSTQVSDLSPLAELMNLQTLYVSNTRVSDLSVLARLTNLRALDLSNSQVSDLSPLLPLIENGVLVKWSSPSWEGDRIYVKDCRLVNPPVEIVQQGNDAILRYFKEKRRSGTIKVREAKLLLVGQGKAGKTTLRRKLEDPYTPMPEPGDTTRGIEITRLDERMPETGEPLRINVWDFGGQNIQHYAHQFFLTGSSLYGLVTNERIEDSVHLPYWLNIIEMLGKKSPVVLIQNKDGGYCRPLRDEAAIRERFRNVHNRVFQTDLSQAATEREFAELRREIVHQASLLPHIEREYLASFAELRTTLEAEADRETHFLRWDEYLALMPELSEELMRDYANALTFLGVCQYFPDDALLRGYVFLRPKWIIDALFTLLLHDSLDETRGHFTENDTLRIWTGPEYRGMHGLLVRMMERFELCYRVEGDGQTYILPQRLPGENQTYGWNEPDDTPVQYRYKFMPKGILTRLICRLHTRIETDPERGQRVWNDAVIFALPDGKGRVFAREVYSENTIELRAAGEKRAEMLNEVIRKMDDINRDAKYENLQVEKLVPCPCHECAESEEPGFHDFDTLQKRIEKGKTTSECKKSGEDVPIDEIFGKSGVRRPVSRGRMFAFSTASTESVPLRVFISYSHAQRDYFPIFKNDFIQYAKLPGLEIEVFGDDEIPIGADWDKHLQDKVAGCDVMLLLVSQEFMNSRYIREREFGAALDRLKQGHKLLIAPIYFAPCLFESESEIARLQFFKPHGEQFDQARRGGEFSYVDLVKFRETDGQPIPNSNRQHYMKALIKKLEPELRKLSER